MWGLSDWCFFFFSSRRRHTRLTCDWSSDVCSSDLADGGLAPRAAEQRMVEVRERALVGVRGQVAAQPRLLGRAGRARDGRALAVGVEGDDVPIADLVAVV